MASLRGQRDWQLLSSRWRRTGWGGLSAKSAGSQLHFLLLVMGALCALNLVGQVVVASPAIHNEAPELFSMEWLDMYGKGDNGCTMARGSYVWRVHGFGSNVNNLLNSWVWALSVEQWEDVALVNNPSIMKQVDCAESSNGQVSTGWNCLFSPMPHLCQFSSNEEWSKYMQSQGVSPEDQEKAGNYTMQTARARAGRDVIDKSLEGMETDHFGALSVMADYLWSQLTPWIKDDVRSVTHADAVAAVNDVPFVGIHIRRGDKVDHHEAMSYEAEQYLAAGVESMLHSEGGMLRVHSIKGLWIASDDPHAIDEVREVYSRYFPSVEPELIIWASEGVTGALETRGVATRSTSQDYPAFVYMFADLQQLTKSELFVGTFSSNIGRLVALLREAGGKSKDSSISIDRDWAPGRS